MLYEIDYGALARESHEVWRSHATRLGNVYAEFAARCCLLSMFARLESGATLPLLRKYKSPEGKLAERRDIC
jgi:hypothetical protein